jgi:hypothetical protein
MNDFKRDQTQKTQVMLRDEPVPAPQHSFDQLVRMSKSLAASGLFGVKDPDQALSLLLLGQAEGKNPVIMLRDYHVINGRPAKSAEAMQRDFQASGGSIEWVELTDARACAIFTHPLAPKPLTIDWDIPRAKQAGLASKDGNMYTKYARAMLRSRCISEGVRSTAPQATGGSYTPEEVRQIEREAPVEAIGIEAAVEQATHGLSEDELDALIMSMDVRTVPDLRNAFGVAWKRAKEAGDTAAQEKLKATYDAMLADIESGQIV